MRSTKQRLNAADEPSSSPPCPFRPASFSFVRGCSQPVLVAAHSLFWPSYPAKRTSPSQTSNYLRYRCPTACLPNRKSLLVLLRSTTLHRTRTPSKNRPSPISRLHTAHTKWRRMRSCSNHSRIFLAFLLCSRSRSDYFKSQRLATCKRQTLFTPLHDAAARRRPRSPPSPRPNDPPQKSVSSMTFHHRLFRRILADFP